MRTALYKLLAVVYFLSALPVYCADINYGRNLTASCANCHGTDGKSVGGTPIIAGLNKRYIIQQMNDFKNGVKPATVMHQIAKGYSDEQIQVIAEYLSNQKP